MTVSYLSMIIDKTSFQTLLPNGICNRHCGRKAVTKHSQGRNFCATYLAQRFTSYTHATSQVSRSVTIKRKCSQNPKEICQNDSSQTSIMIFNPYMDSFSNLATLFHRHLTSQRSNNLAFSNAIGRCHLWALKKHNSCSQCAHNTLHLWALGAVGIVNGVVAN